MFAAHDKKLRLIKKEESAIVKGKFLGESALCFIMETGATRNIFVLLQNYISLVFQYYSNYICMNNSSRKFCSYFHLHLQTEFQRTLPISNRGFYNNIAPVWSLSAAVHQKDLKIGSTRSLTFTLRLVLPLVCPQQTCRVSGGARHTVRFVCVLKTAAQFTAIRHCV